MKLFGFGLRKQANSGRLGKLGDEYFDTENHENTRRCSGDDEPVLCSAGAERSTTRYNRIFQRHVMGRRDI